MAYRNGRLAGAFVLIALASSAMTLAQTPPTLYSRLGGTPVVTAFVAETIDRIVANPETNHSFDGLNLEQVKALLTERICTLAGGGCTDSHRLREVHAAHHISSAEFSAVVEVLRESMRARDVPLAARNQLLELLAPMTRTLPAPGPERAQSAG